MPRKDIFSVGSEKPLKHNFPLRKHWYFFFLDFLRGIVTIVFRRYDLGKSKES